MEVGSFIDITGFTILFSTLDVRGDVLIAGTPSFLPGIKGQKIDMLSHDGNSSASFF